MDDMTKKTDPRPEWLKDFFDPKAAEKKKKRARAVFSCARILMNFDAVCKKYVQPEFKLTKVEMWTVLRTERVRVYRLKPDVPQIEKISIGPCRDVTDFGLYFDDRGYTEEDLSDLLEDLLFHPGDVAHVLWKNKVPLLPFALRIVEKQWGEELLKIITEAFCIAKGAADATAAKAGPHSQKKWNASEFSRPTSAELDILCAANLSYDQIACHLLGWEHSEYRSTQNKNGDSKKGQPVKNYADALRKRHCKS